MSELGFSVLCLIFIGSMFLSLVIFASTDIWGFSEYLPVIIIIGVLFAIALFIAPLNYSVQMIDDISVKGANDQYTINFYGKTINSRDDNVNVEYTILDNDKYTLRVEKRCNLLNYELQTDYTLLIPIKATVLQE